MPARERTETQFRQTSGSLVCLPHRGDMANRWTQAHTTPAGQSLLGLPEMLTSTLRSPILGSGHSCAPKLSSKSRAIAAAPGLKKHRISDDRFALYMIAEIGAPLAIHSFVKAIWRMPCRRPSLSANVVLIQGIRSPLPKVSRDCRHRVNRRDAAGTA
jgi:hypothetical protein